MTLPPLSQAALDEDVERLEALLDSGEDLDQRDDDGDTALHCAARRGHCRSTELLIRRGVNVDLQGFYFDTPLHLAAEHGHSRVARLLISHGSANVNLQNNFGDTPLHLAAFFGHVQVTQELLVHHAGAEVNLINRYGDTSLHRAVRSGISRLAEVILENGAGAVVDAEDKYGNTPLCTAASRLNWGMMHLLVRHNASVPRAFQRLVSTEGFLHWIEDDQHQRSILSLTTDAADIIAKNCWRGMVQLLRYHYHGTNRNRLRPPPVLEDLPSDEEVFLQKHRWMIHTLASLLQKGSGRVLKLLFKVYNPAGLVMEECHQTNRIPLWTALEAWQPQPEGADQQEQPQPEGADQQELQRATEGLEVLLDAASEQLSHPNDEGVFPLLYALEKRLPPQIISKMVDLWPEACGVPHPLNHRIPLALAIEAHMPWHILEKIIKAYPESVEMKDVVGGLFMWELAAKCNCGVTEIYFLLFECPQAVASYVVAE